VARLRGNILNLLGKSGGTDPQRGDLWQVDLSAVIAGINQRFITQIPQLPQYFVAGIALPDQKVKAEPVRRDTRIYQMPSWDEPLEPATLTFHLDDAGLMPGDVPQSLVYRIMDSWRKLVRAGRGAVGSETFVNLKEDYTPNYTFPVYLYMLKGYGLPETAFTQSAAVPKGTKGATVLMDKSVMIQDLTMENIDRATKIEVLANAGQLFTSQMDQGLVVSGIYVLEDAWLSSFKIGQLSYQAGGLATLDAQIYAANILNASIAPASTTT